MGVTGIGIGIGIGSFDLGGASAFSPLSLFAGSEEGAWYDPSDLSTLWQDSAGTTPVTANNQPVGRIDDKSGNGNHAIQATAAARPLYKTSGGLHWLEGDGVDDKLTFTYGTALTGDEFGVAVALEYLGVGAGTVANQFSGFGNGNALSLGMGHTGSFAQYVVLDIGGTLSAATHPSVSASKYVGVGNYGTQGAAEANGVAFTGVGQAAINREPASIALFGTRSSDIPNRRVFGMVAVNRSLSSAERSQLLTYLAEKSGVTL